MKIFFDLDGTILDVSERYYQVYKSFCIQNNINFTKKDYFWQTKRRKKKIFIPKELIDSYKKYWIRNIETSQFIKLDTLHTYSLKSLDILQKNRSLYLVTLRQNKNLLYNQLSSLGIRKYFKKILVTSPALFETSKNWKIKKKLMNNVSKKNDIIVGDTGTDIRCGKSLNLITIAVTSGISNNKILKSYSPNYLIRSIQSSKFFELV